MLRRIAAVRMAFANFWREQFWINPSGSVVHDVPADRRSGENCLRGETEH
jgi:hypothetical protein